MQTVQKKKECPKVALRVVPEEERKEMKPLSRQEADVRREIDFMLEDTKYALSYSCYYLYLLLIILHTL